MAVGPLPPDRVEVPRTALPAHRRRVEPGQEGYPRSESRVWCRRPRAPPRPVHRRRRRARRRPARAPGRLRPGSPHPPLEVGRRWDRAIAATGRPARRPVSRRGAVSVDGRSLPGDPAVHGRPTVLPIDPRAAGQARITAASMRAGGACAHAQRRDPSRFCTTSSVRRCSTGSSTEHSSDAGTQRSSGIERGDDAMTDIKSMRPPPLGHCTRAPTSFAPTNNPAGSTSRCRPARKDYSPRPIRSSRKDHSMCRNRKPWAILGDIAVATAVVAPVAPRRAGRKPDRSSPPFVEDRWPAIRR